MYKLNKTEQKKKEFEEQAKKALESCQVINNNNGTISVIGYLIAHFPLKYLPKINYLYGDLDCRGNNFIKSLENTPRYITGNLWCDNCKSLETLKGAPKNIGDHFIYDNCKDE